MRYVQKHFYKFSPSHLLKNETIVTNICRRSFSVCSFRPENRIKEQNLMSMPMCHYKILQCNLKFVGKTHLYKLTSSYIRNMDSQHKK